MHAYTHYIHTPTHIICTHTCLHTLYTHTHKFSISIFSLCSRLTGLLPFCYWFPVLFLCDLDAYFVCSSSFPCVRVVYMAQYVVCLGECSMWTWGEMCIFLLLDDVLYHLDPVDWWCCLVQPCSYWLSAWWTVRCGQEDGSWSLRVAGLSISPWVLSVFGLMRYCSLVRCVPVKARYHFLETASLYGKPHFNPDNLPCFEVCFFWN